MVQALSDLGSTAEEASDLYFRAIEEGIVMSFYDAGYIDSQTLALDPSPSTEEIRLIRRIINNYYHQKDYAPVLPKDELTALAGLPAYKKNLMLDQIRLEIKAVIQQYRIEAVMMNAFVRENAISIRSYKRRFHK